MAKIMHKNQSVDVHRFSMVPSAEIPRSTFDMQTAHKTTFDAGYLVPFFTDEVLPGDSYKLNSTLFARIATPVFPIMDNLHLDTFFFFVPYRLLWTNWKKFMGEQDNPGDSISFTVPQITSKAGGYDIGSIFDYLGLPTAASYIGGGATYTHSALPLRAYNLIYNQWFRDENMQNSVTINTGNGPDTYTDYALKRRGKRHDYFTSALPWPQKGNTAVSIPIGTTANIINTVPAGANNSPKVRRATDGLVMTSQTGFATSNPDGFTMTNTGGANTAVYLDPNGSLVADLSTATAATINQLRQAFQIQKLLERDARGGTRYTEINLAHFGVRSPDMRLQRPEYLGGGTSPIIVTPIAQQTQTGLTGGTTPLGTLGAVGTTLATGHGFTQSFTEHGIVIGLVSIRADLTYQQGLRRYWSRSTRYDFYWPAFAMLGEQSILNKEIFLDGTNNDAAVFGYQERWAEYRHHPSQITGKFRSYATGTLDAWHASQKFLALPTLGDTFISETPPISRIVAAGSQADGQQFIFDSITKIRATRPMPLYSVPGLIDHF